jgi:hypothetical protein
MIARGEPSTTIGISEIKRARLDHPVYCHPGDHVGEYVPFYFCPRSVMLYVIYRQNHPNLAYKGGQEPIVHLEAAASDVVAWADAHQVRWAFCATNAGAGYTTDFMNRLGDLDKLNWDAIRSRWFTQAEVKEDKQAEFLIHGSFPWTLVSKIGVCSAATEARVQEALAQASHRPPVAIERDWYF